MNGAKGPATTEQPRPVGTPRAALGSATGPGGAPPTPPPPPGASGGGTGAAPEPRCPGPPSPGRRGATRSWERDAPKSLFWVLFGRIFININKKERQWQRKVYIKAGGMHLPVADVKGGERYKRGAAGGLTSQGRAAPGAASPGLPQAASAAGGTGRGGHKVGGGRPRTSRPHFGDRRHPKSPQGWPGRAKGS